MYARLRKRMPELPHDCQFSGGDTTTSYGSVSSTGFWSKHPDDVSYNQLQKFWSELSLQARQELLRIDKQTLFEQARKNMYCSRCNGLLLEGYLQIIMYGKLLQQELTVGQGSGNILGTSKCQTVEDACLTIGFNDDVQDPSVHPWGGLTTARDGTLTLLDCYIHSKYLKGLQNVFDSARARERERELLYPDACGGGGRGWISQGMVGYGRGHGTRETCALHTVRLSVDTLVDFWSALGEETRHSLLRMKEEDFMERLMHRFDSKRFCRDCRKNVIREFKELKELKRMKRETRCTSWFCVADTNFQYEVTLDSVQVDWHQNYADSTGTYKHYEWAVGTGEGKSDIFEFENVGSDARGQVNGLDLTGLSSCYITLRAWKNDGRCNEVTVKAHALKGQHCVHGRLVVGDGFVTITRGESIRRFFEHAEEAEEEEDDDSMDKDGSELDGECSRPQKHAKSPELAREFLLDAATVIFKEQVEKAFREGTARQNAHSMFVSLALKLLEERVMVACKDIITLEKQFKLLEEEEKEKRDEEERKERRRAKEKEKKLRRKERLRSKEKDKEKICSTLSPDPTVNDELTSHNDEPSTDDVFCEEEKSKVGLHHENDTPRRRVKPWKDFQVDQPPKWSDRRRFAVVSESTVNKSGSRTGNFNGVNKPVRRRYNNDRTRCSHNRISSRYDSPACNCYQHTDYRPKLAKSDDINVSKPITSSHVSGRDLPKKVWEPLDMQKRKLVKSSDVAPTKESVHTDLSTSSSNSNSDSCLSCLSEGDGISSNPQNPESSDSESASHRSEVIKQTSPCLDKDTKAKTTESCKTGDQGNIIPPWLQARSIHFPVLQAPSMGGYYPVPWSSGPMPNHHLLGNPYGYGNSRFIPYGVQPPLHNPGLLPLYQAVPAVKDQTKTKVGTTKGDGKSEKPKEGGGRMEGFSLFHFGGPVDASTGGFKPTRSSDEGKCGTDGVEEYNLFATSNGIRFSFF